MGPLRRPLLGGLLLASAIAAPACGDVDAGNQPFAGMVLYEDPAGAFAIRLLEPPWLPPLTFDGDTAFVVPPNDATITTDPTVVLGQALYSLQIQSVGGAPAALVQALAASLPAADIAHQHAVETASGATGSEIAWQDPAALGAVSLFHRDVFVAGAPSAATFHLQFTAKQAIADDPMIAQMIASFDVP